MSVQKYKKKYRSLVRNEKFVTQMKHISYVGRKKLICNMLIYLYFISKLTAVTGYNRETEWPKLSKLFCLT